MTDRGVSLPVQAGARYLKEDLSAAEYVRRVRARAAAPLLDLDAGYAFALMASTLFIAPLGTFGALLFSLTAVAYIAMRPAMVRRILGNRWGFLLFPACAILTALWSDAPFETAKHGCEFLLTVMAALMLSAAPNKRAVVLGLFAAFAVFAVVSLSVGEVVQIGTSNVTAVAGLTDSKNEEAATMVTGFLVSFLFLAMGIRSRSVLQSSCAVFVGAVQIFGAVMAKSAGALAAAGVAFAAFLIFIWLRKSSRHTRFAIIGFGFIAVLIAGVIFLAFHNDVLEWLSGTFNKDMTLTGRTYLWERARELALERPIEGRGFAAFWQQGNLDAEGLWQFAHIQSRFGFNFHSTYYDIVIGMGWIGLAVFAVTLAFGVGRAATAYVRKPTLIACFWLAIAIDLLIRMPIETIGTYEFDFATLLLFALFGSRSERLDARLAPRGRRARGLGVAPEDPFQPRPYWPAE